MNRKITARDKNGDHIIRLHTPYTSRFENYLLVAFKKYKMYNVLQVLLYIGRHGRSVSW